jgi:ketosteroid isomerase-like protein
MLTGLYEPDGVLLPQPGQPVRGRAAMGEALRGFPALKGTMDLKTRYVHESGDLALLSGEWTLTRKGPDGAPLDRRHRSAEVVRRQADGTWKYVLDHPFGADAE